MFGSCFFRLWIIYGFQGLSDVVWFFGFGYLLVFIGSDRVLVVCWYKDGNKQGRNETYSTKGWFCPTKVKMARRT